MIKKLLKYDLLYTYKLIIIYYIIALIFSIFTRIFLNIESSTLMYIIGQICSGTTVAMLINIIINTLIRNWVRFQTNFYKDEAYLTHTLPLSKTKLYLSKFLTSLITMLTSVLVIVIVLFIAYYSKENMDILKTSLHAIANIYDSTIPLFISSVVIVFFLEMFLMLTLGYTGIIFGNTKNNNKIIYSVISTIIIYLLTQGILLLIIYLIGLLNSEVMNLFTTSTVANISVLKTIMYFAIVMYSVFIIIYTFINLKLFNKGVNID